MRAHFMILAMLAMVGQAAGGTIQLFAAGSLRGALTDVANAYEASSGDKVAAKYGASGLLKNEISAGAKVDVFASANMEHPQSLHDEKKSGPVLRFARNKLCALVRPGIKVDSVSLLDRMLDPSVKLGTSTPRSDPSGDYAFEVFGKAEAIRPGAKSMLEKKAIQLTGGPNSPAPPAGQTVYSWHVAAGRADKPKAEHWFGGVVRLPAMAKPGIYQVTLSDEAWIDVIQDGHYARSIGSTGRSDCPGLCKSVRFELNASPFVVQLSGVTTEMIAVAVSRSD